MRAFWGLVRNHNGQGGSTRHDDAPGVPPQRSNVPPFDKPLGKPAGTLLDFCVSVSHLGLLRVSGFMV